MNKATLTRIGGVAAAIVLTATMTACSGGQSVADACKVANTEMNKATSSISSDVNSAMQKATAGEKVDFAGLFAPVLEGLDAADKKITNESVKKPLEAFSAEYKNFVTVFDGFEMPDLKNLDATDPATMDKLTEAQNKMKDVSTKVQDASTKLMDQAKKLQDVCAKG
ncbi:conserved exported hypothetical protein [Microbacterium sp. 8M]|jgi:hypothetical protein|uniref:hypothetical protein n=1 Tax=Microbacterium sp. 8M TaxID=2653153 RepID=UPI0012F39474|nr:hypothetical protein [Microbacterium sp. 8M]VXB66798.1 conserved exported hypothetical protein [Microbacterium sp. 8M]